MFNIIVFTYIFKISVLLCTGTKQKPNIVLFVADDLGWNDVSFHGSSQIPTPNIDALALSGIILNNYYVNPLCTPSRSALMTGKYPIHTGMQHGVLGGADPRGLPLTEKLLPEYLKEIGYKNHIVGKWHLGSYKKEYTPLFRGFDSHLGFWIGHQDYFDHTSEEYGTWGLDMRRNMALAKDLHGKYSTDIFTEEAVRIIETHNKTKPLFIYVAHAAVHSGNSYNPLPSPDNYTSNFRYIEDYQRQRFAGMLTKLDESIGSIVNTLYKSQMLENSIIIFTTDNGGPAAGFNMNSASNYPLRGVKSTLWEGGIRGSAFLWSPLLKRSKVVSKQFMHIVDWFPTILEATGDPRIMRKLGKIDGINMWQTLSEGSLSKRKEVLHNIDNFQGTSSITYETWKLIKGDTYAGNWSFWYGPSGRNAPYNFTLLENSPTYNTLKEINIELNATTVEKLRVEATISCTTNSTAYTNCKPALRPCLFHIGWDPCEKYNIANMYPGVLAMLESRLEAYNKTSVKPGNLPIDPRGFPENWDYAWVNFGDLIH